MSEQMMLFAEPKVQGPPLLCEAVNWPAWCDRGLLLEFKTKEMAGALPLRLQSRQPSYSNREEWATDGCELRGPLFWRHERQGEEIVLRPWDTRYVIAEKKVSAPEPNLRCVLRLREVPVAHLHGFGDAETALAEDWREGLRALRGRAIVIEMHPPEDIPRVTSLPFTLQRVLLDETRLVLEGPQGIYLEVSGAEMRGVRSFHDYWIVDASSKTSGYTISFTIRAGGGERASRGKRKTTA